MSYIERALEKTIIGAILPVYSIGQSILSIFSTQSKEKSLLNNIILNVGEIFVNFISIAFSPIVGLAASAIGMMLIEEIRETGKTTLIESIYEQEKETKRNCILCGTDTMPLIYTHKGEPLCPTCFYTISQPLSLEFPKGQYCDKCKRREYTFFISNKKLLCKDCYIREQNITIINTNFQKNINIISYIITGNMFSNSKVEIIMKNKHKQHIQIIHDERY